MYETEVSVAEQEAVQQITEEKWSDTHTTAPVPDANLNGSKNDGTFAVSFYMNYNESNEMSPYELYEQVYGTGFYWHHQ